MVVSETETVAYDNLTRELAPSSPSLPPPQSEQESSQNSILSLTLDEIQCKSGRMFGSMSMDEFLANIWSSDDNLQVESPPPTHEEAVQNKSIAATEPTISQQASLSVPPPICKKTVDEIWSEIHKDLPPRQNEANGLSNNGSLKKQRTLGEMTLEDFLIKAGVVQESSLPMPFKSSPQRRTSFPLQTDTGKMANNRPFVAGCNTGPAMRVGFSTQQNVGRCMSGNGIATYQMFSQSHSLAVREATTTSAVEKCQSLTETSGNGSKKRIIDGPPEVVVERRQRRMLKNRESAARSRARRQAYTVELEAGLTQLRQENEKLKEILAEAERKRKQEAAHRKHSTKAQKRTEKFRAIRRTVSVAW